MELTTPSIYPPPTHRSNVMTGCSLPTFQGNRLFCRSADWPTMPLHCVLGPKNHDPRIQFTANRDNAAPGVYARKLVIHGLGPKTGVRALPIGRKPTSKRAQAHTTTTTTTSSAPKTFIVLKRQGRAERGLRQHEGRIVLMRQTNN